MGDTVERAVSTGQADLSDQVPASDKAPEADLPALVPDKSSCCGCGACYAVCPVGAIEMKPDQEGFLYPEVDPERCVRCHKCVQACVFKRDRAERERTLNEK